MYIYVICTIVYTPYGKKNYTNQHMFFFQQHSHFLYIFAYIKKNHGFLGIHLCCVLEVVEAPHRTKHPPPQCHRVDPSGSVDCQMCLEYFQKTIPISQKIWKGSDFWPFPHLLAKAVFLVAIIWQWWLGGSMGQCLGICLKTKLFPKSSMMEMQAPRKMTL